MDTSGAAPEVGQTELPSGGIIHRDCTIDFTNGCGDYTLMNPSEYIHSGSYEVPLPPTIESQKSGSAKFTKSAGTVTGCSGVVTYDVLQKGSNEISKKMAVMFDVPFDFNLYSNWYAVGIFDESTKCDDALYDLMNKGKETTFVRRAPKNKPSITYEDKRVTIKATMSNAYQPIMKVEITKN